MDSQVPSGRLLETEIRYQARLFIRATVTGVASGLVGTGHVVDILHPGQLVD